MTVYYYRASSWDDLWPVIPEGADGNSLTVHRFRMCGTQYHELFFETGLKYIKDVRKQIGSHTKVRITRFSRTRFFSEFTKNGYSLDVMIHPSGNRVFEMESFIPDYLRRSGDGRVLNV